MKENQREAMIDEIMEHFDFEKVHKVMSFLDWEWDIGDGEQTVPSTYRLMKQAKQMLKYITQYDDKEYHEMATGGFRAVLNEEGDLELRFEITKSASFNDDYDEEGNSIYK